MLLPALVSARRTAKRIACISNQKQLAIGIGGYFDDNEEKFPPLYYIKSGLTNYASLFNVSDYWFELTGNVGNRVSNLIGWQKNGPMKCPAQPDNGQHLKSICYGLNLPGTELISGLVKDARVAAKGNHSRALERYPSYRILAACTWEAAKTSGSTEEQRINGSWMFPYSGNIAFRHSIKAAPVLYMDGHVSFDDANWLMGNSNYYPVLKTSTRLDSMQHVFSNYSRSEYSPYF
jgi:prepilin-type processing-associated H-X9-DG protein